MYTVGIDIGSVGTKGVLFNGEIVDEVIIPTGWDPKEAGRKALNKLLDANSLEEETLKKVIATGYGRVSAEFADQVITEITCHAKGAYYLNSHVRTIIDIGGQDSKAISLDNSGNVNDFIMNDKCAAGTGKFLEVTINSLGEDIKKLDLLTEGAKSQEINSTCTVFAESEVVSLLAEGASKESIALGILDSITDQAQVLLDKVRVADQVLFTGGLAQSERIKNLLSDKLGQEVITSPNSQLAGALGAAVIAWN